MTAVLALVLTIFVIPYIVFSIVGEGKLPKWGVALIVAAFIVFLCILPFRVAIVISVGVLFTAVVYFLLQYTNKWLDSVRKSLAENRKRQKVLSLSPKLRLLFLSPIPLWLAVVFGPTEEIYHASDFLKSFTSLMIFIVPVIAKWGGCFYYPRENHGACVSCVDYNDVPLYSIFLSVLCNDNERGKNGELSFRS